MIHYRQIESCVTTQTYEFELKHCSLQHYEKLRDFIQTLGKNHYPQEIGVIQIRHKFFFMSFPTYGYPVFKISFHRWTSPDQMMYYLNLLNDYLEQCISKE